MSHRGWSWWTRTQRIRTVSEIPVETALVNANAAPVFQRIAPKALHLQQLGLTLSATAKRFGVSGKTVAKAMAWL